MHTFCVNINNDHSSVQRSSENKRASADNSTSPNVTWRRIAQDWKYTVKTATRRNLSILLWFIRFSPYEFSPSVSKLTAQNGDIPSTSEVTILPRILKGKSFHTSTTVTSCNVTACAGSGGKWVENRLAQPTAGWEGRAFIRSLLHVWNRSRQVPYISFTSPTWHISAPPPQLLAFQLLTYTCIQSCVTVLQTQAVHCSDPPPCFNVSDLGHEA